MSIKKKQTNTAYYEMREGGVEKSRKDKTKKIGRKDIETTSKVDIRYICVCVLEWTSLKLVELNNSLVAC